MVGRQRRGGKAARAAKSMGGKLGGIHGRQRRGRQSHGGGLVKSRRRSGAAGEVSAAAYWHGRQSGAGGRLARAAKSRRRIGRAAESHGRQSGCGGKLGGRNAAANWAALPQGRSRLKCSPSPSFALHFVPCEIHPYPRVANFRNRPPESWSRPSSSPKFHLLPIPICTKQKRRRESCARASIRSSPFPRRQSLTKSLSHLPDLSPSCGLEKLDALQRLSIVRLMICLLPAALALAQVSIAILPAL